MTSINIHHPPLRKPQPSTLKLFNKLLTRLLDRLLRRDIYSKIRRAFIQVLPLILQPLLILLINSQENHLRDVLLTIELLHQILLGILIALRPNNRRHIIILHKRQVPPNTLSLVLLLVD